jgi:hypothetical protein
LQRVMVGFDGAASVSKSYTGAALASLVATRAVAC